MELFEHVGAFENRVGRQQLDAGAYSIFAPALLADFKTKLFTHPSLSVSSQVFTAQIGMYSPKLMAYQIDSCQHFSAPEIPEGLERSFPFFLDFRQSLEDQTSLEIELHVTQLRQTDTNTSRDDPKF